MADEVIQDPQTGVRKRYRDMGDGTFAEVEAPHAGAAAVYTRASAAAGASGNSGDLAVGTYNELDVDVSVTAITGGTAPTIAFILERKGTDGVYYPVYSPAALNGPGTLSTTVGGGDATNQDFGDTVRLRWVFGGTLAPTSVTFSASIKGK